MLLPSDYVASQMVLVVNNPPANAGDIRKMGSIPGSGNPLQGSCLENPMGREACRATVHRVTKSRKQLKQLCLHTHLSDYVPLNTAE